MVAGVYQSDSIRRTALEKCFYPENRNWVACGCDTPVAEGKGDASSLVGQPPTSGGWEKCAEGGASTLR